MKRLIALAVMGLSLAVAPAAFAGAQQEKMKTCNKDAKEKALKGDERKAFMKTCLSGGAAAADGKSKQQSKMKDCNKQAEGKKGDERKTFMSQCLKG